MQIALASLDEGMKDLSKSKEILVHCNTGILASMAKDKLEKAGYKVCYLDAIVLVSEDGTFEISAK